MRFRGHMVSESQSVFAFRLVSRDLCSGMSGLADWLPDVRDLTRLTTLLVSLISGPSEVETATCLLLQTRIDGVYAVTIVDWWIDQQRSGIWWLILLSWSRDLPKLKWQFAFFCGVLYLDLPPFFSLLLQLVKASSVFLHFLPSLFVCFELRTSYVFLLVLSCKFLVFTIIVMNCRD